MSFSDDLCTCENLRCPLHPSNHSRGCSPCVAKNLRLGEIPACFFNKIPGSEARDVDTFHDFARLISDADSKKSS